MVKDNEYFSVRKIVEPSPYGGYVYVLTPKKKFSATMMVKLLDKVFTAGWIPFEPKESKTDPMEDFLMGVGRLSFDERKKEVFTEWLLANPGVEFKIKDLEPHSIPRTRMDKISEWSGG